MTTLFRPCKSLASPPTAAHADALSRPPRPAVLAVARAGGSSPVGRRIMTSLRSGGSVPAPPPGVRFAHATPLRSAPLSASPSGRGAGAPSPLSATRGGRGPSPECSSPLPRFGRSAAQSGGGGEHSETTQPPPSTPRPKLQRVRCFHRGILPAMPSGARPQRTSQSDR